MGEKIITLTEKFQTVVAHSSTVIAMQTKVGDDYQLYTYKKLWEMSQAVAFALQQFNCVKGDRVIIIMENRPEWIAVYFGILLTGAIAVPVDAQSTSSDLDFYIQNTASKIIFSSDQFKTLSSPIITNTKLITVDNFNFENKPDTVLLEKVAPTDIASILYTSGTTGVPKGVMLSHKNFYANYLSVVKLGFPPPKSNLLVLLPLHHSFPFMVNLLIPLFSNCLITFAPSLKNEEILECMRTTNVTALVGVPQLFVMFHKRINSQLQQLVWPVRVTLKSVISFGWGLKQFTGINLNKLILKKIHRTFGKKLNFMVSGGAKLEVDTARFISKLGFTLFEGYGLTETAPIVTLNNVVYKKLGSAGKGLPDVDLKINIPDAQGIGEILIKGPNVMQGYYKLPAETNEALKDGWFYSGDLGYIDSDGFLFITGRKKEIIVLSSGKKIVPEEVETYYGQIPFVKELCILAVGEPSNEKVMAIIVPNLTYFRQQGEINIQDTLRWSLESYSKNYPAYKRILGFIIAKEDLQRTHLGKLQRFKIAEKYLPLLRGEKISEQTTAAIKPEDFALLTTPTGQAVFKLLAQQTSSELEVLPNHHLEIDLGLDSLDRIQLAAELEKLFNLKIPSMVMAQVFTVGELITQIMRLQQQQGSVTPLQLKPREFSWNKILQQDLSSELIDKLNVTPNLGVKILTVFGISIIKLLVKIFFNLKVVGEENLPSDRVFILCSNHASYLDGIIIAVALPNILRERLFFLGYKNYFESGVIGALTKILQVVPIDPALRLVDAMQAAAFLVHKQKLLGIFPEGSRSIDGAVKDFKPGIGILAQELQVEMIPVYIDGSFAAWPRSKKFPKPHKITVTFGIPVKPDDLKKIGYELGAKDDYSAIAWGAREQVLRLIKK